MINVTGTLKDIFGNGDTKGSLAIQLCGFGALLPRVSGTGIIAAVAPIRIVVPAGGAFSVFLYGNDVITPAGTFYQFQICDDKGSVVQVANYQFAGAGVVDLSALAPFNPPNPPVVAPNPVLLNPAGLQTINGDITINGNLIVNGSITPGGEVVVPYAAAPNYDGSQGSVFAITLTGNAVPVFANFGAGKLYTFIIIQDGVGARTFTWPASVITPTPINPAANGKTIQTFVAHSDGKLYPVGPGIYV